ncbi:hypothetical protein B0T18DRAFT_125664 [Schizothecium vesticola]|uniref:Uncharacterized protein n=1 Tax=Schizothecium vesticola TaxID=314040 RepID=A0AA40F3E4_9PEZI|nr:hypothetical protein B0T18DRAFT_125664 [Schizothecium vesticola]
MVSSSSPHNPSAAFFSPPSLRSQDLGHLAHVALEIRQVHRQPYGSWRDGGAESALSGCFTWPSGSCHNERVPWRWIWFHRPANSTQTPSEERATSDFIDNPLFTPLQVTMSSTSNGSGRGKTIWFCLLYGIFPRRLEFSAIRGCLGKATTLPKLGPPRVWETRICPRVTEDSVVRDDNDDGERSAGISIPSTGFNRAQQFQAVLERDHRGKRV